jgi:hypothetical protein
LSAEALADQVDDGGIFENLIGRRRLDANCCPKSRIRIVVVDVSAGTVGALLAVRAEICSAISS